MQRSIAVWLGLLLGASSIEMQSARAGWFSYDNYEDCMLDRMKGQDRSMYSTADKACKKEFKIEFEVLQKVDWEFSRNEVGVLISLKKTPDDIEVTSGEFSFANGDCEGKKNADFGEAKSVAFQNGEGVILIFDHHDLKEGRLCVSVVLRPRL